MDNKECLELLQLLVLCLEGHLLYHELLAHHWLRGLVKGLGKLLIIYLLLLFVYHHVTQIFVLAPHLAICLPNHHVFSVLEFQDA
jgi:hypothetical protein